MDVTRRPLLRSPDVAWFRSLHYGARHVCLWWAVLPDGALHIADELIKPKCLISELALAIKQRTRALGIDRVQYTVALQEAMRGKQRKGDSGETRAETFRDNGVVVREIGFDEAQGWTRIGELLGPRLDGKPFLTISPKCKELVRALTNAVSDPKDDELVLASANDQPLRALLVGAMSRPSPKPFEKPPLPKNAVGHLLEEARRGNSGNTLEWK